jgi:hypothetical protein
MNKGLVALIFISLVFSCNQEKEKLNNESIFNKILVPSKILWDTIPNGFGEGFNLLHKEFEILYITDSTIYKIITNNEIDNDSILIVTASSDLITHIIKSVNQNKIYFLENNKEDSILIDTKKMVAEVNGKNFTALNKISNESYIRLNNILNPSKVKPPNEVEPPK